MRVKLVDTMMQKVLAVLTCSANALLAGCHNPTPTQEAHFRAVESNLKSASGRTTVKCPDQTTCERAWVATQSYVLRNPTTEIRLLNASVIDTYLPEEGGAVALPAWRSTTSEGQRFIRIDGVCGGMYDGDTHWPGPAFDKCALKRVTAFDQFPRYLKQNWTTR